MRKPVATVVITTKNRRDDLHAALRSVLTQSARLETLVIDDGSTDGTSEMVRTEFPSVRLYREQSSAGYIVRRNQAAKLASSRIVVSIDDDAMFPSPYTVEQSLGEFDHPKIGAVAIPFVNVNQDATVHQRAPDNHEIYATNAFIGTAHALRRDVFLRLGGYRAHFVHQGEEGDYCLRMLAAGYAVRLGTADPIHHFESPRRDLRRMDYYGRRNDVLFAWHNVPLRYFPAHLAVNTIKGLIQTWSFARFCRRGLGTLAGMAMCIRGKARRQPVCGRIYRLSRQLKKRGAILLAEIIPYLTFPA